MILNKFLVGIIANSPTKINFAEGK